MDNSIQEQLQAPFSADCVAWRVGSTTKDKTKGLALAYLTNRAIMDRLDEVFGVMGWQNQFREWKGTSQICGISMLKVTQSLSVDCKYIIDVEEVCGQTNAQINSNVRRFADHLISKGLGVGIYTGDSFYSDTLDTSVKDLSLWVAHYGVSKPTASDYVGFQSTDKGKVNGINGFCDIDEFSSGILTGKNVTLTSQPQSQVKPSQTVYNIKYLQHELNIQCSGGLVEDNIQGPKTLSKCPTVKAGARGNITKWIQSRLGISIDGIFGTDTLIAVQKYQKTHKLQPDGIVGECTFKTLLNL